MGAKKTGAKQGTGGTPTPPSSADLELELNAILGDFNDAIDVLETTSQALDNDEERGYLAGTMRVGLKLARNIYTRLDRHIMSIRKAA
jgi:hypothetical protein